MAVFAGYAGDHAIPSRMSCSLTTEAVQMVVETGKPIAEVARDLGIGDGTLGIWVNAYRRAKPKA